MKKVLLYAVLLLLQTHHANADTSSLSEINLSNYVCTDNPSQAGKFGLRSCTDVKTKAISALGDVVSTVIAHYYGVPGGKSELLDFDFNQSSGQIKFCKTVDAKNNPLFVIAPVCNIGDPLISNSSGSKGEVDKNWKGESCKNAILANQTAPLTLPSPPQDEGFCRIDVQRKHGAFGITTGATVSSDFSTCHREQAWVSGMRSQLWQHYYGEVKNEINLGKLQLHQVQNTGIRPCYDWIGKSLTQLVAGDHSDPQNLQYGLAETRDAVIAKYQPTEGVLKTDESQGCLGVEKDYFDPAQKLSDASAEQLAFDTNARGLATEKNHISQAFCHIAYAQRYAEYLFRSLTACEVLTRAKEAYYNHYYSMDKLMAPLMDRIINPCSKMANDEAGISCQEGCAIPHYLSCYKTGNYTGDHNGNPDPLDHGVIDLFQKTSQQGELQVSQDNGLFNSSTGSDGSIIGFKDLLKGSADSIPLCGTMLVPVFKTRRRYKRKKQGLMRISALLIKWPLLICAVCFILSCSNDTALMGYKTVTCLTGSLTMKCPANDPNSSCEKNFQQTCQPPAPSNTTSPPIAEAQNAITTARALAGQGPTAEMQKAASNPVGNTDTSAAKAAFGGIPGKDFGKGTGTPNANLSGLGTGLNSGGYNPQTIEAKTSSGQGNQGNTADGNKEVGVWVDDGSGSQFQGNTGTEFSGGGGGRLPGSSGFGGGKGFGSGGGFGDGSSSPSTGAEVSALDGYLNQNKDQSLFEIVNARYQKEIPALVEP